ncbi:phosphofurin acidic cluster sorting protein 2-like isoform X6 [Branchiostoma floridae]|uniref:Phosphofurin acidic cluster sorting protein 2-like isoform X6 n=1 Tax=Branchiostoma floridae TaxID=7739 RepID=A0A9J7MJI9_BRAFL|nr:phosphofurin acidic cluster sorting protein 2-like isoform X6 [Branchiostoma floridae]
MADKTSKTAAGTGDMKPVPMKLFSSWEVERTAPNCIPRLCSLTLTRLVVLKPLETDLTSVLIAVKMQSSKRVLRSNEIFIPQSGTLDTTLELSFSLQYPHFLKRDSNKLQIMLQRRKRYKNRPVLGFKTLAVGLVNMAQVLQRPMDSDLNMYSKESKSHVAAVRIVGMSSQPVDHEEGATGGRRKAESTADRSPGEDNESDEDDEFFSSDQEGSDSEGNIGGAQDLLDEDIRGKKSGRRKVRPTLSRQRNFKQKFIALLKKFKVPDEVLDSEADQYAEQEGHARDIDEELDLYNIDDLDLSDSGQEIDDNTSIISTPKPSLRPFFSQGVHTISQEIPQTQVMDISDDVGLRPETEGLQDPSGDLDTHSDMGSPARDKKISQKSLSPQAKERPSSANRERSISMRERKVTSKDMARERRNSTGVPEAQGGRRDINTRKLSCPPQNLSSLGVVNEQAEVHHVTDSRKMSAPTHLISNASQYEKSVVRKTKSGPGVLVIQDQVRWGTVPHKSLYDQLAHIIPSDEHLPDSVVLVNTAEWQAQTQLLAQKLQELHHRVVCTSSQADVNATFSFLVAKIQKFCNFNSQQPIPIRVVLVGGESYVHAILRPYVDQFSQKPPDWQNHIKFYIVPLGGHVLARYLASIDSKYNATFNDQTWKEAFEKPDSSTQPDYQEVIGKISSFVLSANVTHQLPIAEAMLTYKAKVTDEESTQTFIPFVGDVRVGSSESANLSVSMDMDDGVSGSPQLASGLTATPTSTSQQAIKDMKETATPPTSTLGSPGQMPQSENTQVLLTSTDPSSGAVPKVKAMAMYISPSSQTEVLDLQIDYWLSSPPREGGKEKEKDKKEMTKGTVKTSVRWLQVNRLPVSGDVSGSSGTLTMVLVTKEKKQKKAYQLTTHHLNAVMRIGKKAKDKEAESKSQTIEAVNRLICTSKSQSSPLKVTIDGSDWSGVKFFQLSAQWQTHIKHFPVGLFGHTETAC